MLFLKKEDIIKSFSMREAIDAGQKATDKAYICQLM